MAPRISQRQLSYQLTALDAICRNEPTSHASWFEIPFGFNHEYNDIRIEPRQYRYKGVKQFRIVNNFSRFTDSDKGDVEAVVEFRHQKSSRYAIYCLLEVLQCVEVIKRYLDGCYSQCFRNLGEFDDKNLDDSTDSCPYEGSNLYHKRPLRSISQRLTSIRDLESGSGNLIGPFPPSPPHVEKL